MKGRSFDTFQVAPGNQEAYTVCRRIALLEEMGPALVVLLGPEGCGKSHLLWSIAKQVRAGTLPAGLALITPDDIPEKVRGLVEDSTPLQGRRAILLVDGLERFDSEVRRLDAVIETFLAYQHPVIIASGVHPNRLAQLPVSLVNRLASARVVAMEPRLLGGDGKAADRVRALEEAAQELQRQRDALQEQLEASGLAAGAAQRAAELAEARVAALQQQADATAAEVKQLEASLSASVAEKEAVERKAAVIQADAVAARDQLGEAMKALEEATSAQAVAESQIALFQEEAEYAMAQQARLQGELSAFRMAAEEKNQASDDTTALQAELAQAQRMIAEAVESLTVMGQQHASLCHDLESDVKELVDGLGTASVERASDAGQAAQLRDALADAKQAQQQMRDTLVDTRERLKGVEFEWAKTRKVLAIQTAEMDALRYETASQMAQASIQAGELEHRIGLLEAAFDSLRATKPEGGAENGAAAKTWSMALENMQAQLVALREARAQNQPERMEVQAHFEDDFFEALPEGFDAGDGEPVSAPLPGDNGTLKEAVEGALEAETGEKDGASIDITD